MMLVPEGVGWYVVLAGNPSVEYQSADEEEEEDGVRIAMADNFVAWRCATGPNTGYGSPYFKSCPMGKFISNFFFFLESMIHQYLRVRILPYPGPRFYLCYFVFVFSTWRFNSTSKH